MTSIIDPNERIFSKSLRKEEIQAIKLGGTTHGAFPLSPINHAPARLTAFIAPSLNPILCFSQKMKSQPIGCTRDSGTLSTLTTSWGNCISAVLVTRLYIRSTKIPALIACATERNFGFSSAFRLVVASCLVKVDASHSRTSGGTASGCTSDSSSSSSASRLRKISARYLFADRARYVRERPITMETPTFATLFFRVRLPTLIDSPPFSFFQTFAISLMKNTHSRTRTHIHMETCHEPL